MLAQSWVWIKVRAKAQRNAACYKLLFFVGSFKGIVSFSRVFAALLKFALSCAQRNGVYRTLNSVTTNL
jgi:hypothetical protein